MTTGIEWLARVSSARVRRAGISALLADVVPDAVWWPQAVVLAALLGYRARYDGGWEDELNIRTHCPTHRGVLADAAADPLADRDAVARAAKARPAARLAVVHDDVLNDLQPRSVAAEIVAFLEALRDDLTPAITIETSTW